MVNPGWILLFLSCFAFTEGYHIHDDFTLARHRRQISNCSNSEFDCGSGICITEDAMCDGDEDCEDGSDENNCRNFPCPKFLYKCAYGACINMGYVCDGKKDCKDNSDETDPRCISRRPVSSCGKFQFECDNGQCISDDDICDGKAHCSDTSDESLKACGNFTCPSYGFRCDYGGCISLKLKCNGQNDCHDGSDEKDCPIPSGTVPARKGDCVLPPHPTNGRWALLGGNRMVPGGWVNKGTVLQYTCNSGFGLSPNTALVFCTPSWTPIPSCVSMSTTSMTSASAPGSCTIPQYPENGQLIDVQRNLFTPGTTVKNGTIMGVQCKKGYALDPQDEREAICNTTWSILPKCLRTCKSANLPPSANANVRCTLNDYKVNCDIPVDGTKAFYSCLPLYEDFTLQDTPNRFCKDGTWDLTSPRCTPICGISSDKAITLSVGGKITYKGAYPWMVGLYNFDKKLKDWDQFCGGSMITPKITLSAAHCFIEKRSTDPADYKVAAGKYYRQFSHDNDKDAQYSDLNDLIIHSEYSNGEHFQANDIAILVLKTPFQITQYILPVCMDYNNNYNQDILIGLQGFVAGWGFTTRIDKSSDVLKELALNYKSDKQCQLTSDFANFYRHARDKMCAKSDKQGESLCSGDSGGGLVFRQQRNRYYIRGIVSIGKLDKQEHGCDLNEPVLFTSVAYHANFIQRNL